jgi:hypothetical protein
MGRDEFSHVSMNVIDATTRSNASFMTKRRCPYLALSIHDVDDCARSSWMGRD